MIDRETKIILANGTGTAAEWYNYMIAFTLPLEIISLLIPNHGKDSALIFVSWTMMMVYLLRPLFAIGFGYLGDRFSRELVVKLSKFMMLSSVIMMSLVPMYTTAGIISTIILVISRILQVGAVSGDLLATMVIAGESSSDSNRAGNSSLVCISMIAGSFLSLIVRYIFSWRMSFIIGIFLLIISELIKNTVKKDFMEKKSSLAQRAISIKSLITDYKKQLFFVFLTVAIIAMMFYVTLSAIPNILNRSGIDFRAMYVIANLLSMIAIYLYGKILNIIGWDFGYLISAALVLLTVVPITGLILFVEQSVVSHQFVIWIAYCWISIINGMVLASLPSILFNAFPKNIRLTGAGFAYNLSVATFGGSVQILFAKSVLNKTPELVIIPMILISLISVITMVYGFKRSTINSDNS